MRPIRAVVLAFFLVLPLAAGAAVPLTLSTNGYLLDGADQAVNQPALTVSFSVWSDPSSPLDGMRVWPATGESACTVAVGNGYYAAVLDGSLSAGCGAGLNSDHLAMPLPRYLQVSVAGVVLMPRMRIASAPTATFALQSADTAALATSIAQTGTLNASANPVDWSRLKNVPPELADGLDATATYTPEAGGGLALAGTAFSVATAGVTNAMLANPSLTVSAGTGLAGGGPVALGGTTSLSLPTMAGVEGSYTHAAITVDAQGRITGAASGTTANASVTNAMLASSSVTLAAGTGLTGGGPVALGGTTTLTLADTGITPNTYTSPTVTVDAQGRITSIADGTGGNGTVNINATPITAAAYTVSATDNVVRLNAASNAITATLPTAIGIGGRSYSFKKLDASANPVIVAAAGGQTIDGLPSVSLAGQYTSVTLVSDGSNWAVTGKYSAAGLLAATGGTVTYVGGYTIHTFTTTGTFQVTSAGAFEYLVVAGGGGGGTGSGGGGGGAGGLLTGTTTLAAGSYTVTVGAGGAGSTGPSAKGTNGTDSVLATFTATGGGGGGSESTRTGAAGGSGGGGDYGSSAGGTGVNGQGKNGGTGGAGNPDFAGGGGGGAGAVGQNGPGSGNGGAGGAGLISSISGSAYYAGGGGGGSQFLSAPGTPGTGGAGGGGTGAAYLGSAGTAGTANTGGGGGGGVAGGSGYSGGSGVVIIRHPT